jgi:Ca2+-binding EF-hand superfamily protein
VIRSTLFAVALVASASSLAQAPTPAKPAAAPSIPRAKVVANAEAEFKRVDTNSDGQMSRAEVEAFQVATAMEMITARNKAIFAALDADKNGQISAAEFAKLNAGTPKVDPTNVMRIDANKDGKISLAEHRNATIATFAQFDTNKDGLLSKAEAEAATK